MQVITDPVHINHDVRRFLVYKFSSEECNHAKFKLKIQNFICQWKNKPLPPIAAFVQLSIYYGDGGHVYDFPDGASEL